MLPHSLPTVRTNLRLRVILWTVVMMLCTERPGVWAAAPRLMSVHDLTGAAELIILGEVSTVVSEWDEITRRIHTRIDLRVLEVLKGPAETARVSFVQPGGKDGEVSGIVADAPTFGVAERVVVFLAPMRNGQRGVVALYQGKFGVELDPVTGQEMAVRRAPGSGHILDRMPLAVFRSDILTHEWK